MQRRLMAVLSASLVCFACGDDKANDTKSDDKKSDNNKGSKAEVAAAGGCKSDKDCKGDRICEDSKCVDPKSKATAPANPAPRPGIMPPSPGLPGPGSASKGACKRVVNSLCQTCGASSSVCTTMRKAMGAMGAGGAMADSMCAGLSGRLSMFSAIPTDQRAMACSMFEQMFSGMLRGPGGRSMLGANPAAPPIQTRCALTKVQHRCMSAAGPLEACKFTAWEKAMRAEAQTKVNGMFKPALQRCFSMIGRAGPRGELRIIGKLEDAGKGGRLSVSAVDKTGAIALSSCAKAVVAVPSLAARKQPAAAGRSYQLELTIECK